ncbi:MAG: rod shape-determining protein MreC [Clostridia bacterium]|jgi:rod shape-determining protein MreC|nr:rod shape-determining protein MreC [Clostridia bacterium]
MKLFNNKLLTFIITVSIILMLVIAFTAGGRTRPTAIEGALGTVLNPIQNVFYSVGEFFSGSFESLFQIKGLKQENEILKEELNRLQEENRKLIQFASENNRLRSLLGFKETNEELTFIAGANVTGVDPGNWFDVYTLDKGSKDGVQANDAIIWGNGYLVGRVIEVGSNYAKFMALVDQRSSVSIIVDRTRDLGIVSGSSDDEIIAVMPIEADIAKGDEISTSGYSTFPKNLYIGKVRSVEKQERKLQKLVHIDPAADFKRLEEVYIVRGSSQ